jgi:hypothetical protein
MSYRSLMKHRVTVKHLQLTNISGMADQEWVTVASNVPCFIDLQYIRMGKDPMWTPEAGRPSERTGVLFLQARVLVHSGDRFTITRGPAGTFTVEGADDEIWTPRRKHHYELGIKEVGSMLVKPQ